MTTSEAHFAEWLRAGHIDVWLLLDDMRRHAETGDWWTKTERQQTLVSSLVEECLALGQDRASAEIIHLLDASLHSLPVTDTGFAGLRRFLQRERRRATTLLRQGEQTSPGP